MKEYYQLNISSEKDRNISFTLLIAEGKAKFLTDKNSISLEEAIEMGREFIESKTWLIPKIRKYKSRFRDTKYKQSDSKLYTGYLSEYYYQLQIYMYNEKLSYDQYKELLKLRSDIFRKYENIAYKKNNTVIMSILHNLLYGQSTDYCLNKESYEVIANRLNTLNSKLENYGNCITNAENTTRSSKSKRVNHLQ